MVRLGLHHLETLCWIDRLGSFAAAAERLNTTQSAISSRVREMESRLKTRLFRKEGRRMMLTLRGRDLVQKCEPLLEQMNTMLLSVGDDADPAGMVSMGLGESAAMLCLPQFLQDVSRSMPKIGWNITVDVTSNLRAKVLKGTLDIALMAAPVEGPDLVVIPIGRITLSWMAAPSFIEARGGNASLQNGPVWALPRPSYQHQLVASAIRASGLHASAINSCNHVQTLIGIIKSGGGMALLSEQLVGDLLAAGLLRRLDLVQPTYGIDFVAVRRQSETDPIVLKVFDQALKIKI